MLNFIRFALIAVVILVIAGYATAQDERDKLTKYEMGALVLKEVCAQMPDQGEEKKEMWKRIAIGVLKFAVGMIITHNFPIEKALPAIQAASSAIHKIAEKFFSDNAKGMPLDEIVITACIEFNAAIK